MNTRMTRLGLGVLTTAAAFLLAACAGTATPPATPGDDAAKGFCDAMVTVTQAAPAASVALNGLFDEMSNEANYEPGADLSNLNTAGSTVVSAGGAYVEALEAAQGFATADSQADFEALIDYWQLYGIALGEFGADADDFVAFTEQARLLIESEDTTALSTAQRAAADRIATAYADACSS